MKNRAKTKRFAGIPHRVIEHKDYASLSGNAVRLLVWFAYQYNGKNNGKLTAIFEQLKEKGFKSKTTLAAAVKELRNKGFIELTKGSVFNRHGKSPNYYAVTWEQINDIPGFEMIVEPTNKALRSFHDEIDRRAA
jgi:predicted transcriptional regulator